MHLQYIQATSGFFIRPLLLGSLTNITKCLFPFFKKRNCQLALLANTPSLPFSVCLVWRSRWRRRGLEVEVRDSSSSVTAVRVTPPSSNLLERLSTSLLALGYLPVPVCTYSHVYYTEVNSNLFCHWVRSYPNVNCTRFASGYSLTSESELSLIQR